MCMCLIKKIFSVADSRVPPMGIVRRVELAQADSVSLASAIGCCIFATLALGQLQCLATAPPTTQRAWESPMGTKNVPQWDWGADEVNCEAAVEAAVVCAKEADGWL